MLDLVLSTVSQGLLWAIMALGVFLTFRVLDIADLSVEGTFPLGAAVAATLIDAGHSVWFAMLIALIAGCIGGTVTALSGALVAQSNGFADVGMGTGTIVIGLASVIIGEVLFGTRSFKNWLISVVLGSVVYRAVIAIVLELGMPPNDLKLFTAVLVAIALSLPLIKNKFAIMKRSEEADA